MRGAVPPLSYTSSRRIVQLSTGQVFIAWYLVKHSDKFSLPYTRIMNLSCSMVAKYGHMVKVKLSLCLIKHHAMKAYWGSGGIAPRIL
jgi:hypothetical protein